MTKSLAMNNNPFYVHFQQLNRLIQLPSVPMPFTWMPPRPQIQSSPPPSPPLYTPSWNPVLRTRAKSSFNIDDILGTNNIQQQQQQPPHDHLNQPNTQVGVPPELLNRQRHELEFRANRVAPYPTVSAPESRPRVPSNTNNNTNNSTSSNNVNNQRTSGGGKASKTKRIRTIFTAEQLERLENEFKHQQYMVGPERVYLASTLQLSEAQVKVWFQNRRIKWRKQYMEQRNQSSSQYHAESACESHDHSDSRTPPPTPDRTESSIGDSSDNNSHQYPSDLSSPTKETSPAKSEVSRSPSPSSSVASSTPSSPTPSIGDNLVMSATPTSGSVHPNSVCAPFDSSNNINFSQYFQHNDIKNTILNSVQRHLINAQLSHVNQS